MKATSNFLYSRKRNQKNSAFLRLPPELRNLIYKEVLSDFEIRVLVDKVQDLHGFKTNKYDSDMGFLGYRPLKRFKARIVYELSWRKLCEEPYNSRPRFPFALTKSCRSIYKETELIPFSSNRFMIDSSCFTLRLINSPYHMFFDSLDRKHLQSIFEICFGEHFINAANRLLPYESQWVSRPALGLQRIVIDVERWKQVPQSWSRQEWERRAQKVFVHVLLRASYTRMKESSFTKSLIVYDVQS